MTSTSNLVVSQMAPIKEDDVSDWFYCQFCPLSFAINEEFELHTYSHFNSRTCSGCNVRLFQICNNWYEIHTTANCKNNNHIHTFNTNNTDENCDGITIKQEPDAEMETAELNELLNIKTDVDLNDFGDVFATTLNTTLGMTENNEYQSTVHVPQQINAEVTKNANSQSIFRVVNIKIKEIDQTQRIRGFKCRFCDKVLDSRFRLDNHIQSYHSVDSQTKCKHCNKKCESFKQLDIHLKRCPWNNRKRLGIYGRNHPHRPKENFQCDICGSVVKKFRSLQDHMNEKHLNNKIICRICGGSYPSRYYLSKHLRRHKEAFEKSKTNEGDVINLDEDLIKRKKYTRVHPHRPQDNFTCDICHRTINRFELLEEHMSTYHSASDSFQCNICGRYYHNRYFLQKHKRRHKDGHITNEDLDKGLMERNKYLRHGAGERSCHECGKKFKHNYQLLEHKSSKHSAECSFQCKKCFRCYRNRYYLAKHMKRHEELEKYGTPIDQIVGDLDEGLIERIPYVRSDTTDAMSFDCKECGITFQKFHRLTEHNRSFHSNDNGYQCQKCNRCFPTRYYLSKHKKRHADAANSIDVFDDASVEQKPDIYDLPHQMKDNFICDFCGMIYNTFELLQEHKISNHLSLEATSNLPTKHNDHQRKNIEGKTKHIDLDQNLMERQKYYRVHPHRPVQNLECDICKKILSSYYSMKDHMKSKHSQKSKIQHPCEMCKKKFKSKKRLERHQTLCQPNNDQKEVNEKPQKPVKNHMCSVCGRLFPEKSIMIMHEETHAGKKTPCHLCGKQFLHKNSLRKHIKVVHSQVKRFVCNIDGCQWKFGYQQTLTRHQARRHGMVKNRNACPICSKEFPDSTYHLKRHLKAHANNTAKEYIPEPKEPTLMMTK